MHQGGLLMPLKIREHHSGQRVRGAQETKDLHNGGLLRAALPCRTSLLHLHQLEQLHTLQWPVESGGPSMCSVMVPVLTVAAMNSPDSEWIQIVLWAPQESNVISSTLSRS